MRTFFCIFLIFQPKLCGVFPNLPELYLLPPERHVVRLLFGLAVEEVAGVKWQIAEDGHGNIGASPCRNICCLLVEIFCFLLVKIFLSPCGNIVVF